MTRKEWLDAHFKQIKKLYPGLTSINGPTRRKSDGRNMVSIRAKGKNYNKQYCRVKMEVKLKRRLSYNETVDHDDGDIYNDLYSNLVLRERSDHAKLDVIRRKDNYTSNCPECGILFNLTVNQVREQGRKKQKAGPFCSRSCRGKYGARVQNGGKRLDRKEFPVVYYNNKGTI